MSVHRAHAEIWEQLVGLLEGGRAAEADVAQAVRLLASGGEVPEPFASDPKARDVLQRLAWLLLARAPAVDPRYLILAPMSIELVTLAQRPWAEVFEDMRLLEEAASDPARASSAGAYASVMSLEGGALSAHVAKAVRAARQDQAAMEAAMRDVTSAMSEAMAPDDAPTLTERGTARLAEGDEQGALDDWMRALQHDPLFPLPYAKRAALRFRMGDHHRALADALTALVVAPRGWELEAETRTVVGAAESALARSGAASPEGQPLTENILALLHNGADDAAIAILDELARRIPAQARHLYFMRGLAHLHAGRRGDALTSFERSLEIDGAQSDVWLRAGQLLLGERRNDEALAAFDKALLHRAPSPRGDTSASSWDLWEAHFGRGVSLAGLGRDAEAIDALTESAAENPDHASTHCYIGICHDRMGRREASIDAYTRALEVDPTLATAWFNRACEQAIVGRREAALSDLERAAAIDPAWARAATRDEYFRALWDDPAFLELVAPHRA